jgi:hypothetical protein
VAYRFTEQEVEVLNQARSRCPSNSDAPTSEGNWAPLYEALSSPHRVDYKYLT